MEMKRLEEANDIIAQARGVIELGGVSFSIGDKNYYVDIEESNINGHHDFKVFLNNPDEDMCPETDPETGEVLDPKFISFIYEEYTSGSRD
jgi:hypothetical protein